MFRKKLAALLLAVSMIPAGLPVAATEEGVPCEEVPAPQPVEEFQPATVETLPPAEEAAPADTPVESTKTVEENEPETPADPAPAAINGETRKKAEALKQQLLELAGMEGRKVEEKARL